MQEYSGFEYYEKVPPLEVQGAKAAADAKAEAEWKAKEEEKIARLRAAAAAAAAAEKDRVGGNEATPGKGDPYVSMWAEKYYRSFTPDDNKRMYELIQYNDRLPKWLIMDPNESSAAKLFYIFKHPEESGVSKFDINTIIKRFDNEGIDGRLLGSIYEGAIRFVQNEKDQIEIGRLEQLEKNTKDEIDERILSERPFTNLLPKLENIKMKKEALVRRPSVKKASDGIRRERRASMPGGGKKMRKTRHKKPQKKNRSRK
jgi:hypothetical protein